MKVPKSLKVGDLIEVIGTDWSTAEGWQGESAAVKEKRIATIHQPGYYLGVRDKNLFWSGSMVTLGNGDEPQHGYTHCMALAAIDKIRRLKC